MPIQQYLTIVEVFLKLNQFQKILIMSNNKYNLLENLDEKYFSDEIRKLDELKNKVAAVLKQALGVAVRVKLVEPKTIERSEGKAKRVIDNRGL